MKNGSTAARQMRFSGMGPTLAAAWLVAALPAALDAQQPRPAAAPVAAQAGWLGIGLRQLVTRDGERARVVVAINQVIPGSPAGRAGVRDGDVLLLVDGRPVNDLESVIPRPIRPGDRIRLRIRRGDSEHDLVVVAGERPERLPFAIAPWPRLAPDSMIRRLNITLDSLRLSMRQVRVPVVRVERTDSAMIFIYREGDRTLHADTIRQRMSAVWVRPSPVRPPRSGRASPAPDAPAPPTAFLFRSLDAGQRAVAGAEFTAMNAGLAEYFGVGEGLLTTAVSPGTPAARAGLQAGDVVITADGRPVRHVAELRRAVAGAAQQPLRLELVRKGERETVLLQPRS